VGLDFKVVKLNNLNSTLLSALGHGTKYIYLKSSQCIILWPLIGIGTLPPPLSPASVALPPEPKGEGAHSPASEGLGESQFRRLEEKLSTLHTLWAKDNYSSFSNFIFKVTADVALFTSLGLLRKRQYFRTLFSIS
jgi:hypothetical protein